MELVHLQSFLAVYRHGNITRASEALCISQPAITSHIHSLETELKRPLFVRLPRYVSPTDLAHQLVREIEGPLESLRSTAAGFRPDAKLSNSVLLLGGPVDVLSEVVLPSLASLATQGLTIRVRSGLTGELVSALGDSELDVVILTTPSRQRGVTLEPFFEETLALVMSSQLAAHLSQTVGFHSQTTNMTNSTTIVNKWPTLLADFPLIAFADNAPLVRRYWRTVFGKSSPPRPRIVVDDLRSIANTVARSMSWSVLPTYLIAKQLHSGELTIPWQPKEAPTNQLYVATRSRTTQPPHVARVLEHLRTAAPSTR